MMLMSLALLPAAAQTVTNVQTGASYADLASAVTDAAPFDTLLVDGTLSAGATIDRDLELVGAPSGGAIAASGAPALVLDVGVALRVEGVDMQTTGPFRVVDATATGNALTLRSAELRAGGAHVGGPGGIVGIVDPLLVEIEDVVFRGVGGVDLTGQGGAISVSGNAPIDLTDVRFVDVEASGNGGALFAGGGMAVTCLRCVFDHTAGGQGGAIHVGGGPLDVLQSRFCATSGSLGGAIFASSDTEVRSSVFTETHASTNGGAIWANGGTWRVLNNHFLGASVGGPDPLRGVVLSWADAIEVRNSLFMGGADRALVLAGTDNPPDATYNWFFDNFADADFVLDPTNTSGVDPELVRWTDDGNCADDEPWPAPIVSPLIDAGDPGLFDLDGTRSDIGAFGGPGADPALWGDGDSDGLPFLLDCDDTDAAIGARRRFFPDCDEDGQGAGVGALECFPPPFPPPLCLLGGGGWATGPLGDADCDDQAPTVYTGADEHCDLVDHDCDGHPYDGAVDTRTWYLDLDGDGFGGLAFEDCGRQVPGWSRRGGDCDDDDPTVFPDATDPCGDDIDQDCDGADGTPDALTPWYADADGDGFGDPTSEPVDGCVPGLIVDHVPNALDCDDGDASVSPAAVERCDGVDTNCNGIVDDAVPVRTWYADVDGDGIGNHQVALEVGCPPEGAWVLVGGDCDDDDAAITECVGCGGCAMGGPRPSLVLLVLLGLFAGARRASAQTLDGDLDGTADPSEIPNLVDIEVPGWTYGDGVDPFVRTQVAAAGVPVYCVDVLDLDSPSNLDSQGLSRHFAHAEALNLPPVAETNEWLSTTVRDLDPKRPYWVRFEASIVRHVGQRTGFWQVSLGGTTLDAELLVLPSANPGMQQWVVQTVGPFSPGAATAELRFEAKATLADPGTVTPVNECGQQTIEGLAELLIDGIVIVTDGDGDGLLDDEDPCPDLAGTSGDQDADGIEDWLEDAWGIDPCLLDTDGDGLTDDVEIDLLVDGNGLCPDPANPDSDGDGVSDGTELDPQPPVFIELVDCATGTTEPGPIVVTSDPCTMHSDQDDIDDGTEWASGTDPRRVDTDGDGLIDPLDPEPTVCGGGLLDTSDTGLTRDELWECCDNGGDKCCDLIPPRAVAHLSAGHCGCASGPGGGAWLGGLLAAGLLIRRRERAAGRWDSSATERQADHR